MRDDRLRLIFTCCHPALAHGAQVALTLRLLGGLTTRRSRARSWCPTRRWRSGWSGRRARSATRGSRIACPTTPICPARLRAVLAVIYLIFNEGYTASSGDRLVRDDLCAEAIRLGRLLAELMPGEPEVMGLVALMLLIESRRAARIDAPTATWSCSPTRTARCGTSISSLKARRIVRRCLRAEPAGAVSDPGRDQRRPQRRRQSPSATDWRQILQLYDQLLAIAPGPVVALNRAVAVAEVDGPAAALTLVDGLDALTSTATICSTRSAPTCSGVWAVWTKRRRRTTRRLPVPITCVNVSFCNASDRRSPELGRQAFRRENEQWRKSGWRSSAASGS